MEKIKPILSSITISLLAVVLIAGFAPAAELPKLDWVLQSHTEGNGRP
jgi:hypothetical protein